MASEENQYLLIDGDDTAPETPVSPSKSIIAVLLNPITLFCISLNFFGGNTFGVNMSAWSGAKEMYNSWHIEITPLMDEIATSSVVGGAFVGVIISSFLASTLGRKWTTFAGGVVATLASVASAVTHYYYVIVVVRFFVGVGVGMTSNTVTMYVSELIDPRVRGFVTSLFQVCVTIGILLSYVVSFLTVPHTLWWVAMAFTAIFPLGVAVVTVFMPESPKFKEGKASKKNKTKNSTDVSVSGDSSSVSLVDTFKNYPLPIFICTVLAVGQQLTGINVMIMYAPDVLKMAGFSGSTATLVGSVGIGVFNFLATLVGLPLSDKLGRKPLLLFGYAVIVISTLAAAVGFGVMQLSELTIFSWFSHLVVPAGVLIIVAILFFLLGFEVGPGPLFFVLLGEICPMEVKGRLMAYGMGLQWICNLIIALFFLSVAEVIGKALTFGIFTVVGVAAYICLLLFTPETRGRDLAEIHKTMRRSNVSAPAAIDEDENLIV
ncbi:General substrate transporter [Carpediemonas membranifera]|uniref:General substrate transporter n=1 Tax=Carpediemonas membranifera TaxID=201153 RepID=A0A8J6B346_9EUKA|nr:General substrate transporter [Carpediemonas membranifera]|eukprot:KAG9393274.1 General substrate transporter [Carpediemonas membranifera]